MSSSSSIVDAPNNESLNLKRVMILATGSRGDIQPFVAIGIALKRKGYAVRILTQPSPTHRQLCDDFGLEHVPFGGDSEAFMKADPEARNAMETGDTIKFFGCLARIIRDSTASICQPFCDEVIDPVLRGGETRPDLILVSYLNRFFGIYARHVLKIPTIEIKMQHWVFDDPSRSPMGMPTLPFGWHRLIHTKLMVPQDYQGFRKFDECIADISPSKRADAITNITTKLSRLEDFLPYDQWYDSEVNHSPLLPMLISQPPIFRDVLCPTLPKNTANNTLRHKYVGPAVIETSDQALGDAAAPSSFGGEASKRTLENFLAASPKKPVYLGWGSMIRSSSHDMVFYAVRVLQQSQQRGIILGGWAGLSTEVLEEAVHNNQEALTNDEKKEILDYAKANVLFVDRAPHEWLFPKVALTVHHGGAGTLNASLRAGVPTIVTPVFGDQYDNAFVVQKLRVGFGFEEKLQKIKAHTLAETMVAVLNDPALAKNAREVGAQLRSRDGCKAVVEEVETYWNETVASGAFSAEISDWKVGIRERKMRNERTTRRRRAVLVSAAATAVLAFLAAK